MKRRFFLSAVSLMIGTALFAKVDVQVNGIKYELDTESRLAAVASVEDKNLGMIIIPEAIEYDGDEFQVREVKGSAFSRSQAYYIELPEEVNRIGEYAFDGCSNLLTFKVPDSVEVLEEGLFTMCTLRSLDVGDGVRWIRGGSISIHVPYLRLGKSVEKIDKGVLQGLQWVEMACEKAPSIEEDESPIMTDNTKIFINSELEGEYEKMGWREVFGERLTTEPFPHVEKLEVRHGDTCLKSGEHRKMAYDCYPYGIAEEFPTLMGLGGFILVSSNPEVIYTKNDTFRACSAGTATIRMISPDRMIITEPVEYTVVNPGAFVSEVDVEEAETNYYDLLGRRVLAPGKGLYIRGGKKVVIP